MILVASRSSEQINRVKFLITSLLLVVMNGLLSAENEPEMTPQQAQQKIEAWLDLEKSLAEERKDFRLRQVSMEQLLGVYVTELDLLEEGIAAAGGLIEESDAELENIKQSITRYRESRDLLRLKAGRQSLRLLGIMNRFPRPLRDELAAEQLSLGDPSTKLRARVLAMIAVVKSTMKFNQVITYSEEVQVVDGVERQLQVLYLGLGRGYYVSGDTAGIAEVSSTGWKWTRKDQYRNAIARAIGVYQKTTRPELVKLPIQLSK